MDSKDIPRQKSIKNDCFCKHLAVHSVVFKASKLYSGKKLID